MALPNYDTDLTVLFDFDSIVPNVMEPSTKYVDGRSPIEDDVDNPIQGTNHGSETMNNIGMAGMLAEGNTFTWTAGHYMFGWLIWTAPSTIDTRANGGLVMLVGSAVGTFRAYFVGGKDYGSYPYGGWQNFVVDPTVIGDNDNGSPTAYNFAGVGADTLTKVAKGNPLQMDVFRYGRGEFRVSGGESGNYSNFSDMASYNDDNSNRLGLFQGIEGGYKFKGYMILGYGSAIEFVDANKSIVVDTTMYVSSDFNNIEVRNNSSIVEWTNIAIAQLGINSPLGHDTASVCGFKILNDGAVVTKTLCVFTDMGLFYYGSNAVLNTTTYRRCGLVFQYLADVVDCIFDEPNDIGLVVDNLDYVVGCSFISSGSGHAISMGTISSDTTVTWDNIDSGYTDLSSGDETIYVSVDNGVTLTINVASGKSTPSVYNVGTGDVVIVEGQVVLTIEGQPVGSLVVLYDLDSGNSEDLGTRLQTFDPASASEQYTYSGGKSGDGIQVKMIMEGYRTYSQPYTLSANDAQYTINAEEETN